MGGESIESSLDLFLGKHALQMPVHGKMLKGSCNT